MLRTAILVHRQPLAGWRPAKRQRRGKDGRSSPIRYYAGVPVRVLQDDGDPVMVATLCVRDEPRPESAGDLEVLSDLTVLAENLIRLRVITLRDTQNTGLQRVVADQHWQERGELRQAEQMADIDV